jgi:hypothetical protein
MDRSELGEKYVRVSEEVAREEWAACYESSLSLCMHGRTCQQGEACQVGGARGPGEVVPASREGAAPARPPAVLRLRRRSCPAAGRTAAPQQQLCSRPRRGAAAAALLPPC